MDRVLTRLIVTYLVKKAKNRSIRPNTNLKSINFKEKDISELILWLEGILSVEISDELIPIDKLDTINIKQLVGLLEKEIKAQI